MSGQAYPSTCLGEGDNYKSGSRLCSEKLIDWQHRGSVAWSTQQMIIPKEAKREKRGMRDRNQGLKEAEE